MSDKAATPVPAFFALPGHQVLSLHGKDALAFAQAQTMNDVSRLVDGQWHWNGWLTPKGRVTTLFALLRLDTDTAWCWLPDGDADAIASALQRFVFRSKLTISVRDDLHVAGGFAAPASARGARISGTPETTMEWDVGSAEAPRTLRIQATPAASDAPALTRWTTFDLAHGLPRLDASQRGQWTPQQLSLDRLQAYSVKKGCYPGQEIVARTHFLGQAKRGLALFETTRPIAPGTPLQTDGQDIGTVVAATPDCLLAVLPLGTSTPVFCGDTPLVPQPLREGLSRLE